MHELTAAEEALLNRLEAEYLLRLQAYALEDYDYFTYYAEEPSPHDDARSRRVKANLPIPVST